jgi:hypothetical protein
MSMCTVGPALRLASAAASAEAAPVDGALPDGALLAGAVLAGPVPPCPLEAGAELAGAVTVLPLLVHPASRHVPISAGTSVASAAVAGPPRGRLIAFITEGYQS